jgi:hypothetical protein
MSAKMRLPDKKSEWEIRERKLIYYLCYKRAYFTRNSHNDNKSQKKVKRGN